MYGFWDPTQRKELSERVRKVVEGKTEAKHPYPLDYHGQILRDFRATHRKALEILERKPKSGIDPNLYILSPQEEEICRRCLDILGP